MKIVTITQRESRNNGRHSWNIYNTDCDEVELFKGSLYVIQKKIIYLNIKSQMPTTNANIHR